MVLSWLPRVWHARLDARRRLSVNNLVLTELSQLRYHLHFAIAVWVETRTWHGIIGRDAELLSARCPEGAGTSASVLEPVPHPAPVSRIELRPAALLDQLSLIRVLADLRPQETCRLRGVAFSLLSSLCRVCVRVALRAPDSHSIARHLSAEMCQVRQGCP